MSEDLHTMLGGYVLHALEPEEYLLFENHLLECEACMVEVVGLTETAALLGSDVWAAPPPGLKDRIMAEVLLTPQLRREDSLVESPVPPSEAPSPVGSLPDAVPDVVPDRGQVPLIPSQQRWGRMLVAALSAVFVAAGAGLVVSAQDGSSPPVVVQASGPSSVLDAPDAQVSSVRMNTGVEATMVMSREKDALVVLSDGLPALPEGKVYQVWLIGEGGPVPHGTSAVRNGSILLYAPSGVTAAQKVGVTVEPAGGSLLPTTTPVMMAEIEV